MRTQRHETHLDGLIPGHTVQGRGRGAWTLCLITALLLAPACTLIGPVPSSNDRAICSGMRILSSYHTRAGQKFWIITEADRSATTILLPEDY